MVARRTLSTSEDSEGGSETRFGAWDETTDRMTSGSSRANVPVRDGARWWSRVRWLHDSPSLR